MYESVVIIGAPRSGTNMLRDMLIKLQGVGTWPCDEINYIWRHGNVRHPSDELISAMVTPKIQSYIDGQFLKCAQSQNINTVVEKTCANSLRVGFVDKVLPESKYIFIVRDGLDVIGSALQRWKADLDIPYILRKARFVPPFDLPYYATRYLLHHLHRFSSNEKRVALWGPVMSNMDDLLRQYTLTEVCALQWKACVDKAEDELSLIHSDRVIRVKYENFVRDPVSEFEKLASFLDKKVPIEVNNFLRMNVSSNSIGKGRKELGKQRVASLRPLIMNTMDRYGYE